MSGPHPDPLADMSEPADDDAFSMLLPWKDFHAAARVVRARAALSPTEQKGKT